MVEDVRFCKQLKVVCNIVGIAVRSDFRWNVVSSENSFQCVAYMCWRLRVQPNQFEMTRVEVNYCDVMFAVIFKDIGSHSLLRVVRYLWRQKWLSDRLAPVYSDSTRADILHYTCADFRPPDCLVSLDTWLMILRLATWRAAKMRRWSAEGTTTRSLNFKIPSS